METLILGSEGMLGTALMRVFEDAIGYDREELDITDFDAVEDAFQEKEWDLIINAAGYTDVDGCETNESLANLINGEAVLNIAKICNDFGIPLVHFSTDYVFDGESPLGYSEFDEPNPINIYGQSKLKGEKAIQENMENFYIIRTSWLFGPNGKNFVETMLKIGPEKGTLNVVNDQIGKPTYTLDLAKAVQTLATHENPYGIYHITNEEPVSWFDFAEEIFDLADLEVKVSPVSSDEFKRPAKRPECSILLNGKFPPLRSHTEALEEYLKSRV
jgi:dTDP-4-dehydrorhamnose reductase